MLNIKFPPETEAKLRERAAAHGQDLATYVLHVVEEELAQETALRPDERIAALREWAKSHRPLPYGADDSRESIYEGRGE
jgi:hypothetical protein